MMREDQFTPPGKVGFVLTNLRPEMTSQGLLLASFNTKLQFDNLFSFLCSFFFFASPGNKIVLSFFLRIRPKKNLNFARIAKRNMNFWADQKNTKLSLTLELINNVFADLPI